jgi:rare lipoprotein A (peptidoglycan hydrolase)
MFKPIKMTLLGALAAITAASAVLIDSPKIQACGNTTYVHSSLDGNPTAYGGVWSSREMVVAAKNRNLRGQTITLRRANSNRTVRVRVTDFSPNSDFDLSLAAFRQLGSPSEGRICTYITR